MKSELEQLSGAYERSEAAFLAAAREGADRSRLAAQARSTNGQRAPSMPLLTGNFTPAQTREMPLDLLTELLADLWSDLASAFEA